jgi:large subunit ribosomal protein L18
MGMRLEGRERRKMRIRKKVTGTTERPRLSVFKSLRHVSAQVVDDTAGRTIVAASTCEKGLGGRGKNCGNRAHAKMVGERMADAARQKGLKF